MKIFIFLFSLLSLNCNSQSVYRESDIVPDLPAKKILNYNIGSSSLKALKGNITIIDFFGTWCAPCIKALPELKEYKAKFKDNINILLVSTEPESKLTKFINSHQPFTFPMLVDEDSVFTNAFQPTSYPYTIVLDKNLKILSITNLADLKAEMLEKFILNGRTMKDQINPIKDDPAEIKILKPPPSEVFKVAANPLVKLSQDFMYAAKTNEEASSFTGILKNMKYSELINSLKNDDEKKAFWINLYNAFTSSSLHKDPGQYKSRKHFFKKKNIVIAGKRFSLDKIEHGLLRRSKIKWSLGYFNKLFPGKTEKELRVYKLDYRIHFALNCGAKSCPPIAFYNPENLNKQLNIAATAYLTGEAEYHAEKNIIELPAILSWFRRDFGGKKKIISLMKTKQLLPADVNPLIKFKKYDWTLYLDNYKQIL